MLHSLMLHSIRIGLSFFILLCGLAVSLDAAEGPSRYTDWAYHGEMILLTTPQGADLPADATLVSFPVLVRLNGDFFDFSQSLPHGEDLRFSDESGQPLTYQIEHWDAAREEAAIWVRIPTIRGNAQQKIHLHWGNADAPTESNGRGVFDASNGYLSVWHMNEEVIDETGTVDTRDVETTPTSGVIGTARHFAGGQGISGGESISSYPTDSHPHTTEVWLRAEQPNGRVICWGNEAPQGKVTMIFQSPPHIRMDCYFSGANVATTDRLAMNEWIHVVHSYQPGDSRLYVNGQLAAQSATNDAPLALKSPARLWIGGWYDNYDFVGDLDEVRVSDVARSPDWVRLEHQNQQPLQTLTGPIVQPGEEFSLTADSQTVSEGEHIYLTGTAGGAAKTYWLVNGQRQATDRFRFRFDAGRVVGDQDVQVEFQAVYGDSVKSKTVTLHVKEAIPEPQFKLTGPTDWDGRSTIEIVPDVTNLDSMLAKRAGELDIQWTIEPFAVTKESGKNKLTLTRAHRSGKLTVTATIGNGGTPSTQSIDVTVSEPKQDAWVYRQGAADEKPVDGQFFARNPDGTGNLHYNGVLDRPADQVFLRVMADGKQYRSEKQTLQADRSYAFTIPLQAGLVVYNVEFGSITDGQETVVNRVGNLVCGDAYLLDGQSNTVATDWGEGEFNDTNPWIRTYGSMGGDPKSSGWGLAVRRGPEDKHVIGYWGYDLAQHLVDTQHVPICIINGAVGGTRIDQHQRQPLNPTDLETIYGRLLWRVQQAGLTHGIRGIVWHQGENDQGADGPTGKFGWETYRQYFIEMAAAWKQDYPNVQHYYVFQIWPKSCAMGINGSDNRLREVQRQLPTAFSNLSIMSTLGIEPPGGCHYPAEGYAQFARLIAPLIERDHYGKKTTRSLTPPNLLSARISPDDANEVVLQFDQPVTWQEQLTSEFRIDGQRDRVVSGRVDGNTLRLRLAAGTTPHSITYLDSDSWSQERLLRGENGLAAFTFCEVPITGR